MKKLCIITTDPNGTQYFVPSWEGLGFGSNFPGGYASCSFSVRASLAKANGWGLGYFWRVEVWEGLTKVWDGEIRRIEQARDGTLAVEAYGHGILLKDSPYLRVWQDTRFTAWEVEANSRQEAWEVDNNKRLAVTAKLGGHYYWNNDKGSLIYRLPEAAHHPDNIQKIELTMDYNLGRNSGSWRLGLWALNDAGATISPGAGEANPKTIATTGKATAQAVSWATNDGSDKMPAGTRQIRLAIMSLQNQVQGNAHFQENHPDITYYRREDKPNMAQNMLTNPSFETGVLTPWTFFGDGTYGVVTTWAKHEYVSLWKDNNHTVLSGYRQSVTCAASSTYRVSVWCKPTAGTMRLKCDNGAGGNLVTVASSTGTATQQLAGTYATIGGQTTLRVILEHAVGGYGYFDMAWLHLTLVQPQPPEQWAEFGWNTAQNDAINKFSNDGGAMAWCVTLLTFNGSFPTSTLNKGWRARIDWQGTGIRIYAQKSFHFGKATVAHYDADDVLISSSTVDFYSAAPQYRKQIAALTGQSRGRYYTLITSLKQKNAAVTEDDVVINLDFFVPLGWKTFPTRLTDLQCAVSDVKVSTTTAATITVDDVADDLASKFSASGLGLSSSTALIDSGSTRDLLPVQFLGDQSGQAALEDAIAQGNQSDNILSWAVWGDKRLALEAIDLTAVGYYLRPELCEFGRSSEIAETILEAYGVYTDEEGIEKRSDIQVSDNRDSMFGGRYRRAALQVPPEIVKPPPKDITVGRGIPTEVEAKVDNYVATWLAENDNVAKRISVRVRPGGILSLDGAPVPLAQVRPGKLAQIVQFPAPLYSMGDLRDDSMSAMIVSSQYDAERDTLALTLGGDYYDLASLLARG